MTAKPVHPIKIFYSYAHEDNELQKQLANHLSPLRSLRRITTWFDGDIQAGTEKEKEIAAQFSSADIILLLISADFMASKYRYGVEMKRAIERHADGIAHVIPILLRPVYWEETPIGTLQCLPSNRKPVTQWENRDAAFANIAQGIGAAIGMLLPKQSLSLRETSILYLSVGMNQPGQFPNALPLENDLGRGNLPTLSPGSQLQSGRYMVKEVLGQGGMGATVLARDTRVDKLIVIKELTLSSSDPIEHDMYLRYFRREVKTLVQIDHPLVPTVFDSFQEQSCYFMIQEYVPGENLEDYMERTKKPMSEREALTYTSQILDILDYLSHLRPPIVHRDIKPANIIIGAKDKHAHLVDFGIAYPNDTQLVDVGIAHPDEIRNTEHQQTSAWGTPGYAPPEQYRGNADTRSDLYALAATLHYLLTNRDPRGHQPFSYPPARSLNKSLITDTERILEHALQINVNNRYRSAVVMKRDIDEILVNHFSISGDIGSYTLGTSSLMAAPRRQPVPPIPPPQGTPIPMSRSRPGQRQMGMQAPSPQPGMYGRLPARRQRRGSYLLFSFLLVLTIISVAISFFLLRLTNRGGTSPDVTSISSISVATIPTSNDGTGTATVNGETIGISSGAVSFDAKRSDDGSLMSQAASVYAAGNVSSAQSLWLSASNKATDDAEPLIYLENRRVKTSGVPYITLIVGTMLTGAGDRVQVGHDNLQGAYIAQKEFNANNGALLGGVEVRLLIANSGSDDTNGVKAVANQVVQAAQKDKTIVGVMGWPYSGQTVNAVSILGPAKIPMVSSTASSNQLSGVSQYFYRVAPPDKSQAADGALYAKQKLNAKNVVLFEDQSDAYSSSLADGFNTQFTQAGGKVTVINYTVGKANTILAAMQQVLSSSPQPDLIYFSGYSSDVGTLLKDLPDASKLQVLGGDALYYDLVGYPGVGSKFNRLRFTAFSYPDEWAVLGKTSQEPAFYKDYPATYDLSNAHQDYPYGFSRAGYNVVLAYDATLALLDGSKNGLAGQTEGLTPDKLKIGLDGITGSKAIQGASGQIAFDPNTGDPVNKAVLVLSVSQDGHVMMEALGAGVLQVG